MEKKKPVVVGLGELLWDLFPTEKKAGGAPINFVFHASRMGAEGYVISAVGHDAYGEEIMQELEKHHIAHHIEKVDYPTGKVVVELNEGIPTYTIIEGVAWDYIPLTPHAIDLVKRADAICFGTLAQRSATSQQTIRQLLSHAPENALRFFDINIRQQYYSKELILDSLLLANILKINDEELELLRSLLQLSDDNDQAAASLIRQYGLRYLILTAGASHSTIYSEDDCSTINTPQVEVADTVGAGDAFSGAFVCSILSGDTLQEAHRKAVDVSAYVCTQNGAWCPYPSAEK